MKKLYFLILALLVLFEPLPYAHTQIVVATPSSISDTDKKIDDMVRCAKKLIGTPYQHGGEGKNGQGFDCSSFVQYVMAKVGVNVPRSVSGQWLQGVRIDPWNLKKGDLVFYATTGSAISHVGIYIGDKKFIHAPGTGYKVHITSFDHPYWKARFMGGRRIIK